MDSTLPRTEVRTLLIWAPTAEAEAEADTEVELEWPAEVGVEPVVEAEAMRLRFRAAGTIATSALSA
eukprot:CAMPEP_0173278456 /NCGR_PEP_ID=MMETSP1143-20121109/4625_1 /TAXON_ID=483371 /ORGANISM="non described non described, Strain CCMP2298" /LENGTH=66 /DNA_ID=CAMNT_0014215619 /DNA_START=672 /DNA_END=868 /DNA_ORIENTATION=+